MDVKVSFGKQFRFIYFIIAVFTAIVGYEIHHSAFYAIVNFIFWPISWLYWLICHDVSVSVINDAFSFFFK